MKGSIDIVTLVIVMVPMSIFLIFGGQRLSKASIDTSLKASYHVGQEQVKSQNKIYQVLNYRNKMSDEPLYKKIVRLPVSPNPDSLNNTIQEGAHKLLLQDTENFYQFVVEYPDGDKIKASTWNDPSNADIPLTSKPTTYESAKIHLPSPKDGFIDVSIRALS